MTCGWFMRKIVLILVMLILICGCNKKQEIIENEEKIDEVETEEENVVQYIDENNTNIGIYLYQNGTYNLITQYETSLLDDKDIAIFDIYPSNEKSIPKYNYIDNLYNDWINLERYDLLKIGFSINYSLSTGENISYNILDPDSALHYDIFMMTISIDMILGIHILSKKNMKKGINYLRR